MKIIELSLCMIVKNEADKIEDLLKTAKKFADEIVVVDTGSTDKTVETVKRYADVFSEFKWMNDFSAARNYAFSLAGGKYLMWLDADDVITDENVEKINRLKNNFIADVYMAKYVCGVDESGNAALTYYRERIIINCAAAKFSGKVHEAIIPFGNVQYADFFVEHRPKRKGLSRRNLNIYLYALKSGEKLTPRELYYMGKEYFYLNEYYSAEKTLKKFLKTNGFAPNVRDAYITLYKCKTQILKNSEKAKKQSENKNSAALDYLFKALELFGADGEILCLLGDFYRERGNAERAKNYYKCALIQKKPNDKHGFLYEKYYYYIPLMWLVTLCYETGEISDAMFYHNRCLSEYPHDEAVIKNKNFFAEKKLV
ncbi:MAG: glycosyltransferase family 2 protein [Candidatus Borkfalkiaceae bacterium]|nr:glycosyltransferase family 2 protein [Christensenellaceae bacterium]